MKIWTVETAQGDLHQIIDEAITFGPQMIARDGDPLVVVVASNEWDGMVKIMPDDEAFSQTPIDPTSLAAGHMKSFVCG